MLGLFTALPKLYKDTRADAFLAEDNPALVYKDRVKEQFGLSDPIVVAIINESNNGVFNPASLQLVDELTEKMSALPNINADRVTSLATENNITGSEDGMDVEAFFDDPPQTQTQADAVWAAVSDFPLYMGNLVSKNKKATLVVAELLDEDQAEQSYHAILDIVNNTLTNEQTQIHVAGEGAIAGYLGSYIDADAQKLNPLAGIIITLIILFAFRRGSPGLLSNVIIAASVLMTLAIMALNDVPFFVITNALPVILIGISVADSIHIYSHYFELQAKDPNADKKKLIIQTIEAMWRPITLTTLTTVAGFIGLYFAAYMPPFKYFGLYTAIGVLIAWAYSLIFLPAAMALIKPSASKKMVLEAQSNQHDNFANVMIFLGKISTHYPRKIIAFFCAVIVLGIFATSYLTVDENRIATFHSSESIYQADRAINQHFNGTYNLDIVVEANENEGLFEPGVLQKIEALQNYALSLNRVKGATSIVDYLKQMNRSLNDGDKENYRLPTDKELVAQYFLIYSASSDPTDFEEEIDYDYRVANIRLNLNEGSYQNTYPIVQQLESYISQHFNDARVSATLSGRVTVNYHWIKDLGESHFVGLAISMFLVWAVSALLFGSLTAGLYAIIPVSSSLLLVYASMVALDIDLGIGTSMFASVAIGLGVDFSIHTIDRLKSLFSEHQGDWDRALTHLFPTTGRALFFNYLAIACGFGVLISSQVVPLTNFGIIVVVSVTTSFLASLSLLPALVKVTKPKFISQSIDDINDSQVSQSLARRLVKITSAILLVGVIGGLTLNQQVKAEEAVQDNLAIEKIIENINLVNEGEFVSRELKMLLVDKRGKTRERNTLAYRKYFGDEKRTILFYKKPTNVKGTSFLTFDYPDPSIDDDQWLYLPALRKVRRISASDRGDYFLGTDFTYEDIKLEGKIETTDFRHNQLRRETITLKNSDGTSENIKAIVLEGIPRSPTIAKELGYGRTEIWVDPTSWLVRKSIFWDPKNNLLKTLVVTDVYKVDDILTRHKMVIDNHKTGHHSEFVFSNVDYKSPVKDSLFTQRAMKRGK
ncbi:MAG: outer membrane lipoprotein-sorting protein [Kangiellaceae bacterium]|nr:outer membrane lipoprotein-sorting protein [Kangiellaceae bacterium]